MTLLAGRYELDPNHRLLRGNRLLCRAWDLLLEQPVALKGVQGEPGSPEVEALEQEFLRLRHLAHPRLVPALELGWHPAPASSREAALEVPSCAEPSSAAAPSCTVAPSHPESSSADAPLLSPSSAPPAAPLRFFTQPWIDAPSLHTLGHLTPAEVRTCIKEVLEVVAWLHQQRITRLDLKPDHLLRTARGWLLIDLDQAGPDRSRLAPELYGTPGYLAPEILAGEHVGPPADLYSLGIIAWEALTDERRRLEGQTLRALHDWLKVNPLPPLPASIQATDPALAALVWRMAAADPLARPTALEALGMLDVSPARWREQTPPPPAPLVGREEALDQAEAARRLAQRQEGGSLVIAGPARSGRSRLLAELANRWQLEGAPTLHLTPAHYPQTPLGLATRLLEHLTRLAGGQPPLEASPPPGGEMREAREARLRGMLSALRAAGQAAARTQGQPIRLMLDDVDQLDELSRAVLSRLEPYLPGAGLLLVTAEAGALDPSASSAMSGRVVLPPLSLEALRAWAEALSGPGSLTAEQARHLLEQTAGNPGAVHAWLSRRWREPDAPLEALSADADAASDLPALAPAMLADALSLAVLPSPFTGSDAEALLSMQDPAALALTSTGPGMEKPTPSARLERLEAAGLLHPLEGPEATRRWAFYTPALRGALLHRLDPTGRVRLSLAAAELLEPRAMMDDTLDPEIVARLFLQAGESSRARPWLQRALEQAIRSSCLEHALTLLQALIDTWPAGAGHLTDLHLRQGEIEYALGRFHVSAESFQRAFRGDGLSPLQQARAGAGLGRSLAVLQRYSEAEAMLEAAASSPVLPIPERLRILHARAWVALRTHDLARAGQVLELARQTRIPAGSRLEVDQLRYEIWLEQESGELGEGQLERLQQGLALAGRLDYLEGQLNLLQLESEAWLRRGDFDRAAESGLRFLEASRQAYLFTREAMGMANLARVERDRGRLQEAVTWLEQTAALQHRTGNALAEARSLLSAADLELEHAQLVRAEALLHRAKPLIERGEADRDGTRAWFDLTGARLRLRRGEREGLEPILTAARDALRAAGQPVLALAAEADLMELALEATPPDAERAWRIGAALAEGRRDARDPLTWRRIHALSALAHRWLEARVAATAAQGQGNAASSQEDGQDLAYDSAHTVSAAPLQHLKVGSQPFGSSPGAPSPGASRSIDLLLLQSCIRATAEGEEALAAELARLVGEHFHGRGLVWLRDGDRFEVLRGHGFTAAQAGDVSRQVMRQVAESGQPVLCPDLRLHPDFGRIESLRVSQAGSLLCWPILHFEECVGVLYIDRRTTLEAGLRDAGRVLEHVAKLAADLLASIRQRRGAEADEAPDFEGLVGNSAPMRALRRRIAAILRARSEVIFLDGETGTGKTSIAHVLHRYGPRANRPFIEADILTTPDGTFDSQFFGHCRGAFTGAHTDHAGYFEVADGATLFLDEIGELPHPLQKKFLKAIEERRITRIGETRPRRTDFLLVTATNRDLVREVQEGRFREDLLYRIRTNRLLVPPLRVRGPEDVAALCLHSIREKLGKAMPKEADLEAFFTLDALDYLLYRCSWPGNVRQLKRMFRVAEIENRLEDRFRIDRPLVEQILEGEALAQKSELPPPGMTMDQLKRWFKELRQRYVIREIDRNGGNVSETARRMGGMHHRSHLINIRDGKDLD